jgi:DNA-binding NarL/FixJ family response regulator
VNENGSLRVVIADDTVLLREGIAQLLGRHGFEVVGQAGDGDDVMRKVRAHKPDLALVDIRMPPSHTDEGIRAALAIKSEMPDVGVVVLSQYVQEAYAMELLGGGADGLGYLLKDRVTDIDAFTDALRRVAGGGSAVDPEVISHLLQRRPADDPLSDLTPREREVLSLMAEGLTNRGIAEKLVVTDGAVERHVTGIFSKLLLDAGPHEHRRVLAVLTFLGG